MILDIDKFSQNLVIQFHFIKIAHDRKDKDKNIIESTKFNLGISVDKNNFFAGDQ